MEPAWTQFESAYKSKINIVMINTDETATPEYKKYKAMGDSVEGIPATFWVDAKGKVLKSKLGSMDARQLSSETDAVSKTKKVEKKGK